MCHRHDMFQATPRSLRHSRKHTRIRTAHTHTHLGFYLHSVSELRPARQERPASTLRLSGGRPPRVQYRPLYGRPDHTGHDLRRQQHQQRSKILLPHDGGIVGCERLFIFLLLLFLCGSTKSIFRAGEVGHMRVRVHVHARVCLCVCERVCVDHVREMGTTRIFGIRMKPCRLCGTETNVDILCQWPTPRYRYLETSLVSCCWSTFC